MYRIKDTTTGKYLGKRTYSDYPLAWTKYGRVYRLPSHIKSSMSDMKSWLEYLTIIPRYLGYTAYTEVIEEKNITDWSFLPDTIIVEHYYTGEMLMTLKELLEGRK